MQIVLNADGKPDMTATKTAMLSTLETAPDVEALRRFLTANAGTIHNFFDQATAQEILKRAAEIKTELSRQATTTVISAG